MVFELNSFNCRLRKSPGNVVQRKGLSKNSQNAYTTREIEELAPKSFDIALIGLTQKCHRERSSFVEVVERIEQGNLLASQQWSKTHI